MPKYVVVLNSEVEGLTGTDIRSGAVDSVEEVHQIQEDENQDFDTVWYQIVAGG